MTIRNGLVRKKIGASGNIIAAVIQQCLILFASGQTVTNFCQHCAPSTPPCNSCGKCAGSICFCSTPPFLQPVCLRNKIRSFLGQHSFHPMISLSIFRSLHQICYFGDGRAARPLVLVVQLDCGRELYNHPIFQIKRNRL